MEDNNSNSDQQTPNTSTQTAPAQQKKKNKFSFTWILLIVFALMIANNFRPKKTVSMNWFDYETGVQTAQQQDKPLMIAFFKKGQKFSEDMLADTYKNQNIIDYIEANFVPVYVNVDKQQKLAEKYSVSYYPMHLFATPDNKEIVKTRRGYDTPSQFMPVLNEALEKMDRTPK